MLTVEVALGTVERDFLPLGGRKLAAAMAAKAKMSKGQKRKEENIPLRGVRGTLRWSLTR